MSNALFALLWGGIVVVAIALDRTGSVVRGRFRLSGRRFASRAERARRRAAAQRAEDEAVRVTLLDQLGRPAVSKRRSAAVEHELLATLDPRPGGDQTVVDLRDRPPADAEVIDLRDHPDATDAEGDDTSEPATR